MSPFRELYISWRFLRNDVWAGILPGVAFTLVALRQAQASPPDFVRVFGWSVLYFWFYLYGHTLANQIVGIEEDRINKPERPLPSGLVSRTGALRRLAVVTALLIATGFFLGVGRWALLWAATYLLLNFFGHRHWFWKNTLPMSVGAVAMLGAAWEMVRPMSGLEWRTVLSIAGFVAVTSPIQDFRDIEGDRVLNRKTLPLAVGERRGRILISLALVAWLPVAWLILRPALGGPVGKAFALGLTMLELLVAVRLLRFRGAVADHRTYRLYEQLYCLYVVSAFALLS
jgi:4-hydroxybenzoate polyprenyltransferase